MRRTNIYLSDDQVRALRYLAADEHQSVAALVRQAVDKYLVGVLPADGQTSRQRFDDLVRRVQARQTSAISGDEIEADITRARAEVRLAHRAANNG
ncbi:MAG: ribbon-helix-helix domain-containing protein [Dehalococcoidia bacterium]